MRSVCITASTETECHFTILTVLYCLTVTLVVLFPAVPHCEQLHASKVENLIVCAGNQVKEELRNRMPPSFSLSVTPLSE